MVIIMMMSVPKCELHPWCGVMTPSGGRSGNGWRQKFEREACLQGSGVGTECWGCSRYFSGRPLSNLLLLLLLLCVVVVVVLFLLLCCVFCCVVLLLFCCVPVMMLLCFYINACELCAHGGAHCISPLPMIMMAVLEDKVGRSVSNYK